jgi:hypothetical protein
MFTKKFLDSDAYKKASLHHKPLFTEFGTRGYDDPDKNIFIRVVSKLVWLWRWSNYSIVKSIHLPTTHELSLRVIVAPLTSQLMSLIVIQNPAHVTDNNAANIVELFGKLYAFSETCYIHEVDPTNLDTGKKVRLLLCDRFHLCTPWTYNGTFFNE